MIRFHSKAGADILMLRAHAEAVLEALGREPAPQGIFEGEGLASALLCWSRRAEVTPNEDDGEDDVPDLPRRAWPLLQLLRRAQAARVPVTWSST